MSWSVSRKGTREEVKLALEGDFEGVSRNYPPGTPEGDDVAAAKARCLALLDALTTTPASWWDGELVQASAYGSHSTYPDGPAAGEFTVKVSRVAK